jgi:hypothetical protein
LAVDLAERKLSRLLDGIRSFAWIVMLPNEKRDDNRQHTSASGRVRNDTTSNKRASRGIFVFAAAADDESVIVQLMDAEPNKLR